MKARKNNELPETLTPNGDEQGFVIVQAKNNDPFRERMRALVEALGSIAEIARKCGLPESTVKKWVDGLSDPSRERCLILARGTGVSLLWLVAGEGPMWASETAVQSRSHEQRLETLRLALQLAAEALEGKHLPPEKFAELVSLIYEGLEEGLPQAQILRFARIAKPG